MKMRNLRVAANNGKRLGVSAQAILQKHGELGLTEGNGFLTGLQTLDDVR
jgi:hypothetical protein